MYMGDGQGLEFQEQIQEVLLALVIYLHLV